ncbi:TetR/AcrR family transcriptional regulator [Trebonia kvetii]|uniref:TetR/AcrR family transcriptional regulator n=1 Tax=Trebonia kvetii TaxID=2480626 RepID=UPI001FEB0AC4|nr:TetR/AcrR family transcriptional regulator [Trebonia kvetii]
MASGSRPYHHGNLRPALICAAIGEIEESGPAAMSLRAVARRAGVTHAAATYHFGDRAGLLTAVAAEGYRLLAEALRGAQETRGSFLEVGVAYVRFAVTHRAHFEVMYRPELYHRDDAELGRARAAAATLLYGTGEITRERMAYGVAAWSIVHGLATLWLNGNLPAQLGDDPEEITRAVAAHLSPPRRDPALAGRQPAAGRLPTATRHHPPEFLGSPVLASGTRLEARFWAAAVCCAPVCAAALTGPDLEAGPVPGHGPGDAASLFPGTASGLVR